MLNLFKVAAAPKEPGGGGAGEPPAVAAQPSLRSLVGENEKGARECIFTWRLFAQSPGTDLRLEVPPGSDLCVACCQEPQSTWKRHMACAQVLAHTGRHAHTV